MSNHTESINFCDVRIISFSIVNDIENRKMKLDEIETFIRENYSKEYVPHILNAVKNELRYRGNNHG